MHWTYEAGLKPPVIGQWRQFRNSTPEKEMPCQIPMVNECAKRIMQTGCWPRFWPSRDRMEDCNKRFWSTTRNSSAQVTSPRASHRTPRIPIQLLYIDSISQPWARTRCIHSSLSKRQWNANGHRELISVDTSASLASSHTTIHATEKKYL